MHETPHGFFHLDTPTLDTPANGLIKLSGWAAGIRGRHFADMRVRADGKIHPVVYGFPRVDLADFFKLSTPFLPGGFELNIPASACAGNLVFEALDIAGQWHDIHRESVPSLGEAATACLSANPNTVQPHEFARVLLSALHYETSPSAALNALPNPAVLRFPNLPFHGHLHQPTLTERVLFGRLRIEGWLFHETASIRRVTASVDLQTWQDLALGGSKAYVASMYPQFDNAKECRIDGLIDIPAQLPDPKCVRIYAELEDGSWHLCQVQRVHTWDQEIEKQPLAPYSLLKFVNTVRALNRASRANELKVSRGRDYWRGLRKAHREYQLRARPPYCPALDDSAQGKFTILAPATSGAPRHITLFTHNLALEGAPLFLAELARAYVTAGTKLQVIAAEAGPLSALYEELGASVHIVPVVDIHKASSEGELSHALENLRLQINLRDSDLIVANTLSMWWAVHLAHKAQKPSLFYLHESTTPATFYLGHMAPSTLPLIQRTFKLATCASFLTETTRHYYRPWLGRDNHGINPGWIDVCAIDRELARLSRDEFRRQLGVGPDKKLVVNIGSVCDRKGQHIFTRGVDLLWRQHPATAQTCQFLMIGGRDTLFDHDLKAHMQHLGHDNIAIIPTTASPLAYYLAADLFVCSSYEESLPRVVMEAMAARTPILSTAVHGINDLLPGTEYGQLISPGDTQAICTGLHETLNHLDAATTRAEKARARVVTHFNSATLLPRHLALAACVATSHP